MDEMFAYQQQVAGVPLKYHALTAPQLVAQARTRFEGKELTQYESCVDAVVSWAHDPQSPFLVLSGSTGSGKSALAACVCGESDGVPGWVSAQSACERFRSQTETPQSLLHRGRPLVVDDLGCEYATYFSTTAIDALVACAYDEEWPLVLTTNMNAEQLADAYTPRFVDRLVEMSLWLVMDFQSFRRPKGV